MATSVGMSTWEVPFPSLVSMASQVREPEQIAALTRLTSVPSQIALFFVIEDAWHYVSHRILHHKKLYKHIHK